MRYLALVAWGLSVVAVGGWLRFSDLERQPFHADEAATGAQSLADRLEGKGYEFDPSHRHGPLLTVIAESWCRAKGETSWEALNERTLREIVAVCGLMAAFGSLALGLGWIRALVAASLAATSPLLVYYSRLFIHEPVFLVFAIPALAGAIFFLKGSRLWLGASLFGIGVGLMAATRETVVISLIAWTVAGVLCLLRQGELKAITTKLWKPVLLAAGLALALICWFYTEGGKQPSGFLGFFKTYFDYETGEGHDKAFYYYLQLLAWPKLIVARWWTEGAILLFALCVYLDRSKTAVASLGRFLFEAGIVHLLVFSLFSYKVPWLPSLAWLHVCFAAGAGGATLIQKFSGWGRWVVVAGLVAVTGWHGVQAQRAAIRLAADGRNPYAYVPTSRDVTGLGKWLSEVKAVVPDTDNRPIAVIGEEYWPLPWYLRGVGEAGYWAALPEGGAEFPILIIMPTAYEEVSISLQETHTYIPRGLRDEFPVMVAIRNDIWEAYQER